MSSLRAYLSALLSGKRYTSSHVECVISRCLRYFIFPTGDNIVRYINAKRGVGRPRLTLKAPPRLHMGCCHHRPKSTPARGRGCDAETEERQRRSRGIKLVKARVINQATRGAAGGGRERRSDHEGSARYAMPGTFCGKTKRPPFFSQEGVAASG